MSNYQPPEGYYFRPGEFKEIKEELLRNSGIRRKFYILLAISSVGVVVILRELASDQQSIGYYELIISFIFYISMPMTILIPLVVFGLNSSVFWLLMERE